MLVVVEVVVELEVVLVVELVVEVVVDVAEYFLDEINMLTISYRRANFFLIN